MFLLRLTFINALDRGLRRHKAGAIEGGDVGAIRDSGPSARPRDLEGAREG